MGKRSSTSLSSVVSTPLDKLETPTYNKVEQSVAVVCKFPAHVYVIGQATGQRYDWAYAGSVVNVDIADLEQVLSKKVGERSCCGASGNGNVIFEKV